MIYNIFNKAKQHTHGTELIIIDKELNKYDQRRTRWKKIALSASKRKMKIESPTEFATSTKNIMFVDSQISNEETSEIRRLSFTSHQVSPPKENNMNDQNIDDNNVLLDYYNDDDFGNDGHLFEKNEEEDDTVKNSEYESDASDESEFDGNQFRSPPRSRKVKQYRKCTPMSSGKKKVVHVSDCGGIVVVSDDESEHEHDKVIMEPSSVVRLQTVRIVHEKERRSLGGSRKALTPVRRSARLLHDDDESMLEKLQKSEMTFVPNPSLQGSSFAKEYDDYSDDDEEEKDEHFFDAFNSGNTNAGNSSSSNISSSSNSSSSNSSSSSSSSSSNCDKREATPMFNRCISSSSEMLPPPPPILMGSISIEVENRSTPIRRSSRVFSKIKSASDETPAHIRKEMEAMLNGF